MEADENVRLIRLMLIDMHFSDPDCAPKWVDDLARDLIWSGWRPTERDSNQRE